jgi:hypothetical protein
MSDDRPRLKFITAIVADDIRREVNNKEFFIGVYAARMVFGQLTPNVGVMIAISVLYETPKAGNIPTMFRISGPNDAPPTQIEGFVEVPEPASGKIVGSASLSGILMTIERPGNIVVEAKSYKEDDWKVIRILPVIINPDDPGLKSDNVTRVASIGFAPPAPGSLPVAPATPEPLAPSRLARPTRRRCSQCGQFSTRPFSGRSRCALP